MRAKVILSAAGVALLVLVPTVYLRFHSSAPDQPPAAPEVAVTDTNTAPAPVAAPVRRWTPSPEAVQGVAVPRDQAADPSDPNHGDYVLQRRAELAELGMSDDPAALKTILSELNNPDLEIRKAALSAAVQFGSQDALPMLKNELTWAEDPQEKVDIQNAIDFLQLPPASEVMTNDAGSVTQQPTDAPPPQSN